MFRFAFNRRPSPPRHLGVRLTLLALDERALPSLAAPVSYPAGGSLLSGDFNNDGNLDLAADGRVLLGNGDGTFGSPMGSAVQAFATADFNGDGRLDLATYAETDSGPAVGISLGEGDGTFTIIGSAFSSPDIYQIVDVATGDLNNDGYADLLIGWHGYIDSYLWPAYLTVRLSNGDGTFSAPLTDTYHLNDYGGAELAAGDFNVDGQLDVVADEQVFQGHGDGTLTGTSARAAAGQVADFNGDGRLDLAADGSDGFVRLYSGNGDGTFQPPRSVDTGGGGYVPVIGTADIDGDGVIDLIVDNDELATISVMLGLGDSSFRTPQQFAAAHPILSGVVGDFNRDGFPDLAVASHSAGTTDVYINRADWVLTPSVIVNDMTIREGDSGTTAAAFMVTLSMPVNHTVTVGYRTEGIGSGCGCSGASGSSDYQPTSGTLIFAPGETSKSVTVLVNGDYTPEQDEAFAVRLLDLVGGFAADDWAVGTIVNDDPFPTLSISDVSVMEGHSGGVDGVFTITLSEPLSDRWVYVNYVTADGTAAAGSDYAATSGMLAFAPGETSQTITVRVYGDRLGEPDENFFVSLTSPENATVEDGQGMAMIRDDEPRVSINSVSKSEGRSGRTAFTFTVSLSAAYDQQVTLSFTTQDGTAKAGSDYQAKSGTLTFKPGETTKTITIEVFGDRVSESNETFTVRLFNLSANALFLSDTGVGTILNDD